MPFDPILDTLLAQDPTLGGALPPTGPGPNDFAFDPALPQTPQDALGAPVAQAAPGPLPGLSSARVAESGVDLDILEAIQTGPVTSRYDKRLAGLAGGVNEQYAKTSADLTEVGKRDKAALAKLGALESSRAGDMAQNQRKIAEQEFKQASDIQKITDAAWSKVNEAGADYQKQLATLRASRVDPSGGRDTLARGMDGVRSMFALNLIATGKRGLVDAGKAGLEQLDKDIQRSIDAQVENLRKDKDVAEGFRAAWALASQNAVSEEQAKTRVTGMILQSYKDQLSAEVATKYDSDLARATAERMAVDIDKKILETDIKQREHAQKHYVDLAQIETQRYVADQQASLRRKELALERDKFDAAAGKGKSLKDMGIFPVADPETKEFRYSAKTEKGQEILDDLGASSDAFSKSMENLESYVRDAEGDLIGGTDSLGKLKDSKDKKVAALARTVAFNLAKMLNPDGKISDADAAAAADSLSIASILTRDEGVEARDAIRNFVIDNTQSYYGQYAYDIDPAALEKLGFPRRGAQRAVQEGQRAQANTQAPVSSKVEKASGGVDSAESRQERWLSLDEADRNWAAYVTAGGKYQGQGQDRYEIGLGVKGNRAGDMVRQPGWADEISQLGVFASDPALPQSQRLAARKKLEAIKKDGENTDKAFYAKYILDDLAP